MHQRKNYDFEIVIGVWLLMFIGCLAYVSWELFK